MFLALALKVVVGRHRLGIPDAAMQERVVAARLEFQRRFAERNVVEFYDPQRFSPELSIQDNILFGRPVYEQARAQARLTELVREVALEVGMEDALIHKGLEFNVGASGARLSYSQKQRIAIARALMKDPDVLVMDEPTSGLDPVLERMLVTGVLEQMQRSHGAVGARPRGACEVVRSRAGPRSRPAGRRCSVRESFRRCAGAEEAARLRQMRARFSRLASMAADSEAFYASVPVFRGFASVMDPDLYKPLPDDWTLGVADIVQSTQAIAQNRYKAVNMAGAAVIAGVRNALGGRDLPYVFGGDGAGFAVSPRDLATARDALAATATWTREELGLAMRVALVPVARVREAGLDVRVARFAQSGDVAYAMFSGGGLGWAEAAMKRGEFAVPPALAWRAARAGRLVVPLRRDPRDARRDPVAGDRAGRRRRRRRRFAPRSRPSFRWSRRARRSRGRCPHPDPRCAGRRAVPSWKRAPRDRTTFVVPAAAARLCVHALRVGGHALANPRRRLRPRANTWPRWSPIPTSASSTTACA